MILREAGRCSPESSAHLGRAVPALRQRIRTVRTVVRAFANRWRTLEQALFLLLRGPIRPEMKEIAMSLIRWEPFSEMDRMFNRMFSRVPSSWPRLSAEGSAGPAFEWSPSADISETEKEYLIRAELPAVRKEDVKVTVDQGIITIEGERKQQKEEKNEKFHRVESFYGTFSRSFSLPENTDVNAIRCESKDGVLTVHIPKTEKKETAKQISVQ
jgi:HSP20 family protein